MLEGFNQLEVEAFDDGDGLGKFLFGQLGQPLGLRVLLLCQQAPELELVGYLQEVIRSLVLTRHPNQSINITQSVPYHYPPQPPSHLSPLSILHLCPPLSILHLCPPLSIQPE